MVYPDNPIGVISETVLGLTDRQANAVSDNGWENLMDFGGYTTSDIKDWATATSKLTPARGGLRSRPGGYAVFVPSTIE